MALETATFVSDLVLTNPIANDPVSQSDDHHRLIKTVLQNTFPDGSASIYGFRAKTKQATTSGTAIDFTAIPSWVQRVTMVLSGVSLSGAANPVVQIGSGAVDTTSTYLGAVVTQQNALTPSAIAFTTSFALSQNSNAASVFHGQVVLVLLDSASNTWSCSFQLGLSNAVALLHGAGAKTLSGALDRVRLTSSNGTDTFDAGAVNVLYE